MLRLAIAVAALLVVAWIYRAELTIAVVGAAVEWMRDTGPHREIDWQRGPDEPAAPPSERPPNIVLILADDMGWNDVSTHGGGAGGGSVKTPNIDAIAREGVVFRDPVATIINWVAMF